MKTANKRILNPYSDVNKNGKSVIYWMSRDQRVSDNFALLYAQELALKFKVRLEIVFVRQSKLKKPREEIFEYVNQELSYIAQEAKDLNISFTLIRGTVSKNLVHYIKKEDPIQIVTDYSPLRGKIELNQKLINNKIPLIIVDTHNIVPPWIASNKQEFSARTFRPKINTSLKDFLHEIPKTKIHKYGKAIIRNIEPQKRKTDISILTLNSFKSNISIYEDRNDPTKESTSKMSKFIHFGNISTQRVALEILQLEESEQKERFLEELIVRRELSENFCYYNENYDSYSGIPNWAKLSLEAHIEDKREYIYKTEAFEFAKTHDFAWNAAQNQLVKTGFMHGYMRMYWAKKILEWTNTPKEAIAIAIYLNDKYQYDGRDPNGYTGILWSIGGLHDRPWFDRPIYGKVRYMNFNGLKRKFEIQKYIDKWNKD